MKKIIVIVCAFASFATFAKTFNCKSESGRIAKFNGNYGELTVFSKSGKLLVNINGLRYGKIRFLGVSPVIKSTELVIAEEHEVIGALELQTDETSIRFNFPVTKYDKFICK